MMHALKITTLLLLTSQLASCALLTKAEPMTPRYFSAEASTTEVSHAQKQELELRLGTVSSASHLDERIAFRKGNSEVGFYADRRWTEIPEEYLRRALEFELFEVQGLQRIVSGAAPTLVVELIAFEEFQTSPESALILVRYSLQDESLVLLQDSLKVALTIDETGGDAPQQLAGTLSKALVQVVKEIATRVEQQLEQRRASGEVPGTGEAPLAAPLPAE